MVGPPMGKKQKKLRPLTPEQLGQVHGGILAISPVGPPPEPPGPVG